MNREEAQKLKEIVIQQMSYGKIMEAIDSLVEPKHQWKIGGWAWSLRSETAFKITRVGTNALYDGVGCYGKEGCIPIPAPKHEIGQWIQDKHIPMIEFKIEEREWRNIQKEWLYRGDKTFMWESNAVPYEPTPKFKMGQVIKFEGRPWKINGDDGKNYCLLLNGVEQWYIPIAEVDAEATLVLPQWHNLVRTPDGVGQIASCPFLECDSCMQEKRYVDFPEHPYSKHFKDDDIELLLPSEADEELKKIRKG